LALNRFTSDHTNCSSQGALTLGARWGLMLAVLPVVRERRSALWEVHP
jgi:hypothetical protein